METLVEHARVIRGAATFRQRVAQALALRFEEKEPSAYAEQRIYGRFPQKADERLMQQFHQAEWSDRHLICGRLEDERFAEFGLKLLYAHMPDALPYDARQDAERVIRERLLAEEGDVPWLTLAGALSAVTALREAGDDATFLDEIEQFILTLRQSLAEFAPSA